MNKVFLAAVFFSVLLFGCNNPQKTDNTSDEAVSQTTSETTNQPVETASEKTTLELLQGKWQHAEDPTNYLVFENNIKKEIAEGMDNWDEEEFILSDNCLNDLDKDKELEPEKDKYITYPKSDICLYINNIDENNLELVYLGRGNTLKYKRVN